MGDDENSTGAKLINALSDHRHECDYAVQHLRRLAKEFSLLFNETIPTELREIADCLEKTQEALQKAHGEDLNASCKASREGVGLALAVAFKDITQEMEINSLTQTEG